MDEQYRCRVAANHIDWPDNPTEASLVRMAGLRGRIARGGHIVVTHDALVFQPHAFNAAIINLHIPVSDITAIRAWRRWLSAFLTVTTITGQEFDFISWKREMVMAHVDQARGELGLPPL